MVVAEGGRYGGVRSRRRQRRLQEAIRMEGGTNLLFGVVVEIGSEKQETMVRRWRAEVKSQRRRQRMLRRW